MRSGPGPSGTPVTAPASTVTLDGTPRPHLAVSVSRDLPSDLPASVAAGGGLVSAGGEVTWAPAEVVTSRDVSPWAAGAVPAPGTPVTVDMDAGHGAHRVFTGAVEDTTGGTGKASASTLVDHIHRLDARVSIEPLLRLMPPASEGGDYRRIGLSPIYVVDRVMRACRYFTTPPLEYDPAVSVPLQGSVWPERGTCTAAGSQPASTNAHATFYQADGRLYAADVVATYAPRVSRPGTTAVCLSLTVASTGHTEAAFLHAYYGATAVTLVVHSSGAVSARYGATTVAGPIDGRGARVSLLVKGGTWTLRTSTGLSATGTQAVTSTAMSSITLSASAGARIAGAQISYPRGTFEEHATLAHVPNARVRPGVTSPGLLDATPAIVNERGIDVLRDISKALCSPLWLDEDGVLQWAGPDVLRAQSPAVTITARDSLLALDWRVSLDHTRSTTTVKWDKPAISVRRWPNVTLWEGRKETLNAGDELREFIDVPADEDWIGVNLPGLYAGADTGGDERLNRGIGSWVGGYRVATDGTAAGWVTPAHATASLSRVTHATYLHEKVVNTTLPAGVTHVVTEVSPASAGLWPKWDGQALPILRGYAKTTWTSVNTDSVLTGPADRPPLVHDAGPWVQHAGTVGAGDVDVPARLAGWLATQVNTPTPEVTGLEVMPDPRIQLGDVIALADPDNLGVALTGLVVGLTLAQSGPGASMVLALRVISANPTHATYDHLQAAWTGANYAALEAAWSGQPYAALEARPLEESP
ncbi:MAG: hypothetical protein Q4F65_05615 [Propionibacteriaceae bacterium]|nr:hypothetical protein [Propionibacteriaceae bacterium]